MSVVDLGSDVGMIFTYLDTGENAYAWALLGMIALTMMLQINFVVANHHKNKQEMVFRIAQVLTGTKAGFDAYHVATEQDELDHVVIDSKLEHLIVRAAEVACEAIPYVPSDPCPESTTNLFRAQGLCASSACRLDLDV